MPVIRVAKRFMYNDGNKLVEYLPGNYEVPAEMVEHWYVRAHLVGFPEQPRSALPTYMQASLKVEQAARMAEPVAAQEQEPAPTPPGVHRAGGVPDGATYFAGTPQEDKELPKTEPPRNVSYAQPPRSRR